MSSGSIAGRSSRSWKALAGVYRKVRKGAYYLLTGAWIAVLAFINGYPLVYSDTGTYIYNAFRLEQLEDRPIGYGLIIRAVTWQSTLWTVVLFQGAVVSWLLMLLVRSFISGRAAQRRSHLILIGVLVLGSSLPWYAAQIMADIFTPLVMIIAFLIYHGSVSDPWRRSALWILLFFFVATHNSHFLLMAGAQGLLLIIAMTRWRSMFAGRFWVRWMGLNALVLASASMIVLFNWVPHGTFRLSRASNVFMAGRLCEDRIMGDYLHATCAARPHALCAYKDRLPKDGLNGFLWADDGFVHGDSLTLAEADTLLAPLVADLLHRREYLLRYACSALRSTGRQLMQWEAGAGLHAYGPGTSPHAHLWWRLPREKAAYEASLQQRGVWSDLSRVNAWLGPVLLLAAVILIAGPFIVRDERKHLLRALTVWTLFWMVMNAFVTSSLSIVDPRTQSRVLWLIPMVAFFIIHAWMRERADRFSRG